MTARLYADSMIEIYEDALILKGYRFLCFGKKRIAFSEIKELQATEIAEFAWRVQGTHDLRTWWTLDWRRGSRPFGFLLGRHAGGRLIGFSAADPKRVSAILQEKLGERFVDRVKEVASHN